MTFYDSLKAHLNATPRTWLITGVAGFIGSNLLETLLKLDQRVVGLDNFSTGHPRNLEEVQALVSREQWRNFQFRPGDIRNLEDCRMAMQFTHASPGVAVTRVVPVDFVLHQAALGSVPRSIQDPISTNQNNIDGFLNMLVAARDARVERFVYAASSSTYGDHPALPKVEDRIGKPLSPYAVTKLVNELYADVFAKTYGFRTIGLRYFNVFGRRQDPAGPYAAVIPRWIAAMINGVPIYIYGDGETSRDFCPVDNIVQANLLAATTTKQEALNQVYNVSIGKRTDLLRLCQYLQSAMRKIAPHLQDVTVAHADFRKGDVRHSHANIGKAKELLNYEPQVDIHEGIDLAMDWYIDHLTDQ